LGATFAALLKTTTQTCNMISLANRPALHILLADDDEDDRELFEEAFATIIPGIRFTHAVGGDELIQMLQSSPILPDLVIMDLNMPKKTGLECLEEIRSYPQFRNLPVMVYSTTANQEHVEKAYLKGANMYLQKPNNFQAIRTMIEIILSLQPDAYIPQADKNSFLLKA